MSFGNNNWVCTDCRYVVRVSKSKSPLFPCDQVKCIHCGNDCYCMGSKYEIPKKNDKKSWKKLAEIIKIQKKAAIEKKNSFQKKSY